jgi:Amt family ammonium transporter
VFTSIKKATLAVAALIPGSPALADTGIAPDVGYMLNTFFALVCAVLVMFMAAGFAMLEAGMVRSKSVAVILAKNISLYAIASIMFFLVGYELMYGNSVSGLFGEFAIWRPDEAPGAAIDVKSGQPSGADWFFQMVFVATAASVVSGALAERVKYWPFVIFVVVLTGVMYLGGWAALAGVILLGSRRGRFAGGRSNILAPSSLPLVTLGTFILWLGWFGFNGGSQLSFSTPQDALAVATIFANTNAGAAGGVIAVTLVSQLVYRRLDLTLMLNGALAGLVSVTAEPLAPTLGQAALIGAIGGLLMMVGTKALERLLLDDVVGAIPVHLVGGTWGTLAVGLTNEDASFAVQLAGVCAIGVFTFVVSYLLWAVMRRSVGIRLKRQHEYTGGDMIEVGMRAYNLG